MCVSLARHVCHGAGSNQLLHRFSPVAAAMLSVVAPVTEIATVYVSPAAALRVPAFRFTKEAAVTIVASAMLGLLVSLSTFLVIGHTSALTYNVVGHLKTVGIVTGGVLFYSEVPPPPLAMFCLVLVSCTVADGS